MKVKAKLSNLRISSRKVRLVADLIRGKSAAQARNILNFTVKRATRPLLKLLDSAIANAKNNFKLDPASLYVASIEVNEGRKLKRSRPRARGQAYPIQKKTSHVIIILDEMKKGIKSKPPKKVKSSAGQTQKHVS